MMRAFGRLYYAVLAMMLAAVAVLPWLGPVSYRVLGFDPGLARAGTFPAFQAHLATTALRRHLVAGVLVGALTLLVLSIAGLVLRARRRTDLPWPILTLSLLGAGTAVMMALGGLVAGTCC